ncbi:MAG: YceI family protein [Opitutaceae bacterium]|nr:YceI family protein [Cytophagales bacterium]
MKKIIVSALTLLAGFSALAQTYTLDKTHAKLNFIITHLMISDVDGSFKDFSVKLTSTKEDLSDAVVDLTAAINSIDTDNDQRDTHLKGPDYFDAAKFPTLTFKSKSMKKVGDKKYKLAGDVTIHGVTKPLELDVVYNGSAIHPYTKKTVVGFKITGLIKRSDFGVGASTPSAVLSDEVPIVANVEFIKE